MEKRREAMIGMPKLIKLWKKASHYMLDAARNYANVSIEGQERMEEVAEDLSTATGSAMLFDCTYTMYSYVPTGDFFSGTPSETNIHHLMLWPPTTFDDACALTISTI